MHVNTAHNFWYKIDASFDIFIDKNTFGKINRFDIHLKNAFKTRNRKKNAAITVTWNVFLSYNLIKTDATSWFVELLIFRVFSTTSRAAAAFAIKCHCLVASSNRISALWRVSCAYSLMYCTKYIHETKSVFVMVVI